MPDIFSDLIGKLDVLYVHCPKLIDWLDELIAECPKKIARNMNDPCGARCRDLARVL
ncbi:MAG: hypothetical protein WA704_22645 [Pseudolabrys sp.]